MDQAVPADKLVDHLKNARKSPAVLKIRLLKLREVKPGALVFAFEGDDDKIAYYQWIKRIRPNLPYEPLPCRGKKQVLALKRMLDRDLNGLQRNVYYFVDRDFDLNENLDGTVFVTDRYAVENYLVEPAVLEDILKNEFHCDVAPIARTTAIELFKSKYGQFLALTKEVNRRIYVGIRSKKNFQGHFPDKIGPLATVTLRDVVKNFDHANNVIVYAEEPSAEQVATFASEFDELIPELRYRGKFAYAFFWAWLECLIAERCDASSAIFVDADKNRRANVHEMTFGAMASKSEMPIGLKEFVEAIT
ncbi:hypothetical protein BN949_02142 [Agrobacterium tumefaciens]|nr:hypothetical protein BN949_02142 [Agrobacterium tumefaciens]